MYLNLLVVWDGFRREEEIGQMSFLYLQSLFSSVFGCSLCFLFQLLLPLCFSFFLLNSNPVFSEVTQIKYPLSCEIIILIWVSNWFIVYWNFPFTPPPPKNTLFEETGSLLLKVKRQATYRLVRWQNTCMAEFFFKILVDTCPFVGPLIPLFWTSGVSSGFQSQNGQPYLHLAEAYVMYVPPDSPLVQHLLTSWQQA